MDSTIQHFQHRFSSRANVDFPRRGRIHRISTVNSIIDYGGRGANSLYTSLSLFLGFLEKQYRRSIASKSTGNRGWQTMRSLHRRTFNRWLKYNVSTNGEKEIASLYWIQMLDDWGGKVLAICCRPGWHILQFGDIWKEVCVFIERSLSLGLG